MAQSESIMLVVETFTHEGRTMTLSPPLVTEIRVEDGLLNAEDADFNIFAFGETLDELSECAAEQLLFMWDAFACESPGALTRRAQEVRSTYLARAKVTA